MNFWKNWFRRKPRHSEKNNELIELDNIKAIVVTDLGNVRTNNEDMGLFVRIADENIQKARGHLLLVADGMGGHNAGEVASRMAAEVVSREYFRHKGSIETCLAFALKTANQKIYEASQAKPQYRGMGTTCTAIVIQEQQLYFAHVGDSRAYLFKNQEITRLTEDHTYVQELVKNGEITAEEAETHPKRNLLTNAMGTKPTIRIDVGKCTQTFDETDKILVCSDGLYDYLTDVDLTEILEDINLREMANFMVQEAKNRGGHDNITVVLVEKNEAKNSVEARETRDFDIPSTQEFEIP
jgi:PPM family protein phosphatase